MLRPNRRHRALLRDHPPHLHRHGYHQALLDPHQLTHHFLFSSLNDSAEETHVFRLDRIEPPTRESELASLRVVARDFGKALKTADIRCEADIHLLPHRVSWLASNQRESVRQWQRRWSTRLSGYRMRWLGRERDRRLSRRGRQSPAVGMLRERLWQLESPGLHQYDCQLPSVMVSILRRVGVEQRLSEQDRSWKPD